MSSSLAILHLFARSSVKITPNQNGKTDSWSIYMRQKKQGRSRASRSVQTQLGGLLRPTYERQSDLIDDVMEGKKPLEDTPEAIQSAVRLPIYEMACMILDMERSERQPFINNLPVLIRPHIEAETRRIYNVQRTQS